MLKNSKKELQIAVLFTAAFLLGGFIHVVMNPWDFTSCIAQIYYSTLVLIWAVTINYRIVNKKVRQLMLVTAALFLLAFFLQMCRYRIFELFVTASRYFWYGYYIPVVLVPLLFLFVVLHLHLQEDEKPNRHWLLMLIPSLFLVLLVMTNDLHQLVFVFSGGTEGRYGTYTHGVLFYALYIWVIAVLVLALYLAIRQCRIPSIGKKLWLPLYFAAFEILNVFSLFDMPKIAGTSVWLFIECLAMIIIGMEESCIRLGLIPANSSYRTIFRLSNKPMIVSDQSGTPVHTSAVAREMFQRKGTVQIHTKPIRGGSVSWAVDLSRIMELNRELEKATEGIESRNELLRTENALKEEQSKLAARNALYNRIARIISPQLDAIQELIRSANGADADSNLAKIVILNTYIKRRSNMELLRSDRKSFPTEELVTAIRESCEYLKLCGVDAMLHTAPGCELSADTQISLYEAFETVLESCLDSLHFLLVNITMRGAQPVLRMALNTSAMDMDPLHKRLASKGGIVCTIAEDDENEVTITITRKEGGTGT